MIDWEKQEPASDGLIREMKAMLDKPDFLPYIDPNLIARIVKLAECQKVELADRAETIRLLLNDQNETVEQETAR